MIPFSIRVYLLLIAFALVVHAQPPALTITTEPNAIVWIDEVRRGTTDASGKLALTKISPGRHTVRVRANRFKETTAALLPGRRTLAVKLIATTDGRNSPFKKPRPHANKHATTTRVKKPRTCIAKQSNCGPRFRRRTSDWLAFCST